MHRIRLAAAVAALLLAAPTVTAAWSYAGLTEPDTPEDVTGGFQWTDAPAGAGRGRVYFNAFPVQATGEPTNMAAYVNANPLPTGSRLMPVGQLEFSAILGVWRDCDGDDHVGTAGSALMVYRAELLPDGSPCRGNAAHVVNGWVWEYFPLYPYKNKHGTGPAMGIPDADLRVWGDFGRPGEAVRFPTCEVLPFREGALRSTGGVLGHADCHTGYLAAAALRQADPDGRRGLSFEDPAHPQRECDRTLNRDLFWDNPHCDRGTNPWEEDPGNPAFQVFDCSTDERMVEHSTPVPDEQDWIDWLKDPSQPLPLAVGVSHVNVSVAPLDPRVGDPTRASFYEGADNAVKGVNDCKGGYLYLTQPESGGPVWTPIEDPNPVDPWIPKRQNDFTLRYAAWGDLNQTYNGNTGGSFRVPQVSEDPIDVYPLRPVDPYLEGLPRDYGVQALDDLIGGGWRSFTSYRAPTYRGTTFDENLDAAGGLRFTFYAAVSDLTLALYDLPRGAAPYGREACEAQNPGWDCQGSHWWNPEYGAPEMPNLFGVFDLGARHGDLYHLRDVDCYDGEVAAGSGVHVGLAALAASACQEVGL